MGRNPQLVPLPRDSLLNVRQCYTLVNVCGYLYLVAILSSSIYKDDTTLSPFS